jgi:starvation-inducible DNA-binding protein
MKEISVLNKVLANTFVFYNKTQQIHWNLRNPSFLTYHKFFQSHYEEYQNTLDEIAELVVQFDNKVEGRATFLIKDADIKENVGSFTDIKVILKEVAEDHKVMIDFMESNFDVLKNPIIADFITQRLKFHHKALWMVKASI